MNSLNSKSLAKMNTRLANLCSCGLILILSLLCTGCVGLTSADMKKSTSSTAPKISIAAPSPGATVSGSVLVTTSVSSNTTSVQFEVDGNSTGTAVTDAPFEYSLDATKLSDGAHSLTAVASNSTGHTTTSAAVSIIVNNALATPQTISIASPASGATVSGTISVTTNVSANISSVQFKVDGNNMGAARTSAPFNFSLNTTTLSNGTHSLTTVASNAGGHTFTSAPVSITIKNAVTTPPTVSISSPASGATVSGTINVSTNVSGNTTSVQFNVDGNNSGAAVTGAPFSLSLNTATLSNAGHSLTAVASNAGGQTATSAAVSISVNNANSGGTGGLTPSGPVTLSGQSGVTIQNLHITNPNGDCVTITNSTNITIKQSEIGPCKGNGVVVSGGDTVSVVDNYIHPEGTLTGCCDVTDGIFTNGTHNLTIQGNVIAYGEANIEANGQTNLKVIGNFLLNPRGGGDSRGQNVQVWANNTTTLVQNNYALASTDTAKYKFAEVQEDSINFGASPGGPFTTGVIAQNNYITGGHSNSGCGIIADTGANSVQFLTNIIVNSG